MMKRREFITLLGGAAAAWPLAARAQQPSMPVIGFIGAGTPSTYSRWVAAFVQRLRELGRIEGGNIAIEYRWAEGRSERFAEVAAEFVRLKVDVIVTVGSAVLDAKRATSVIPIVFAVASDPVGGGLVESLARPGGNVTGLSVQNSDLAGKASRTIARGCPRSSPCGPHVALVTANRVRISTLANVARLPTMHGQREHVEAGGLMSYAANFPDLYRHSADLVVKILRGAKPGDIPIEQPTKFDLIINLTTAKALGLEVPPTLLARADEVIE
jgi:putative tryptophan/tyrosine transport system substrate-binding protein